MKIPIPELPPDVLHRPFIGKYSILDFFRSLIALAFIVIVMSALTLYIHKQIDERALHLSNKKVEYVTIDNEAMSHRVPGAAAFVVESIVDFPISHGTGNTTGYIMRDDTTGVKYLYINSGKGGVCLMTRYWEK